MLAQRDCDQQSVGYDGELKVKEELLGKLCNSIAIGHEVEVQKLVNYPDYVQYKITWIAVDWCCADDLPEREYEFVQKVIANIDPECTLDEGEIGRASCREREERGGGDSGGEQR